MPSPATPVEAGLQSLVVAALLFVLGFLITGLFAKRLGLAPVVRLALAVPALMASVCVVMIVHMATGGGVLAHPVVVRSGTGVALAAFVIGSFRRRSRAAPLWRDRDIALSLVFVVLGVAVWCLPVFTSLPVSFHGDVKRHMAWAAQLSAAHSSPTGVITGNIPNYYPWLFHAFASFTAAFTPGGRVLHALGPLQVLAVAGNVLVFFAAGSELFRSRVAAAASALLGAISGGFGFLLTRSPVLVTDPRIDVEIARVKGDFMFLRSYNLSFHNLAPPFPRDFGFVLLVAMLLLLVIGMKQRRPAPFVGAGIALGLIGLTTGESFIVGGLFALVLIAVGPAIARVKAVVAVFIPAVAIYALWTVPVLLNYARLGGFADTSGEPVILPPLMILFSWGISVPLAVIGICTWRWWKNAEARVVLSFAAASVAAVAAAGLAPKIGEGFTTLGRHHRYWPLVYVGVALGGALGAREAWRRLVPLGPWVAVAAAAVVVGAAVASPLLGTIAVTRQPVENADLATALRGDDTNVLNVLAPTHGYRCVVAAPQELSRSVPAYTGARLVYFPSNTRNQAGIRWPMLPDPIPDEVRLRDHKALIFGNVADEKWREIVASYGVDRVVVGGPTPPPVAARYPSSGAEGAKGSYVVVRTGSCSRPPS
ncbi:MAG TPA: hypothetical protein VG929_06405 [Actinomycetota bacterium]|nr:hypothetical protein [Actinomycetota bacterium]